MGFLQFLVAEKLESLEKQLPSKAKKETFGDEDFIEKEFDSMFLPLRIAESPLEGMDKIISLQIKIKDLESSIHHTRTEKVQLASKLQMLIAEYDDCNSKLENLLLKYFLEKYTRKSEDT